jgi:hypothetical protein
MNCEGWADGSKWMRELTVSQCPHVLLPILWAYTLTGIFTLIGLSPKEDR